MIKIEIFSTDVETKSGVSARTNKPYSIREQEAYAHVCDKDGTPCKFPVKVRLNLEATQVAYAVGTYTLAPQSLFVDRFDNLQIGKLALRSAPAAPASAARAA